MKPQDIIINIPSDETVEFECIVSTMEGFSWYDYKAVFTNKGIWFKRPQAYLVDHGTDAQRMLYELMSHTEDCKFMRRRGIRIYSNVNGKPSSKLYFDDNTEKVKEIIASHINQ